jgi:hypothetical protein
MKISGSSTLDAPVEQVWEAIQDPAVLARCIPGCESLTTLGEDRYAMSVTAVIASAIEDAEGFPITSMPISPVELWELRQRHARGELPSLARTRHTPSSQEAP